MNNLLSIDELELEFHTPDFVLKTQQQIAKDFTSSGLHFERSFETEELLYSDIVSAVQEKIEVIMLQSERQLLQLLYQIDVSQSQFLELTNQADFSLKLSELIVRREAFKVFLRGKF